MTLGEKIKTARENRGMTQNQLGAAVGVTEQAVYYFEPRLRVPSVQTLPEIPAGLALSPAWLCGLAEL